MNAQHTPGPWRTDPECGNESVLGPNGAMVADCAILGMSPTFRKRGGDNDANARLIAAAPDLLEALEALRNEASGASRPSTLLALLANADLAIAKAKGAA